MARYLGARRHPTLRTLEDVVRFNGAHATEELSLFGQDLFEKAAAKGGLDSPEYVQALATCRRVSQSEGIDALLAGSARSSEARVRTQTPDESARSSEARVRTRTPDDLDALVAPTGGPAWLTDFVNGDAFTGAGYALAAIAGYPSITVPCGATHGLPLGVCFLGRAWSEPVLIGLAYAYEQETRARIRPTYAACTSGLPAT
jgi:amidase